MATGPDLSSSSAAGAASASAAAKKDRHIVSWSAEEDDVLRAQIAHHGTDNWTIIATQFKDKTARQCRRRWYNYLNTECKKGGWSREEDMLLCEAQKILGNKWTEIAKVVSGRTDNAVKNRFSTLCKKRGKDEELFKENGALCSNANAKRVLTQTGCVTSGAAGSSPPTKQMRSCSFKENISPNVGLFGQQKSAQEDSRQPLAIIPPENQYSVNMVETQNHVAKTSTKQLYSGEQNCVKHEGNFLKKDDPKFATLLHQADLLCSLATKLNTENTSQSMDEAWQQLQHHLVKRDDNDMSESSMSGTASLLEELDALIVDPYENEEEDEQKSREQNGQINVDNEHSNGSSQTSMQVSSPIAPDEKMDNCPKGKSTEDSSLCRYLFGSSMEPCPGTEIPVYVNLGEAAEDSMLCCMEYTSPAHIVLQAKADEEAPVSVNLSEAAEGSWPQCMEYMSPAHTVSQAKADAEIPAPINLSESAKDSSLHRTEYTSASHRALQAKAHAERQSPENFSEVAKDRGLQFIEFTSPTHTAIKSKAGAEMSVLENCTDVAKDSSKLPCIEFASPAHAVPTFQPFPDDMPTPKITASERNFLLSVLDLTSPGSIPDTSQQPSCKRALLNSL